MDQAISEILVLDPSCCHLKWSLQNFKYCTCNLFCPKIYHSQVIGPNRNVVYHSPFSVNQAILEILVLDPSCCHLKWSLQNFKYCICNLFCPKIYHSQVIGPNRNVVCHSPFSVDQAISEILVLDPSCCHLKWSLQNFKYCICNLFCPKIYHSQVIGLDSNVVCHSPSRYSQVCAGISAF